MTQLLALVDSTLQHPEWSSVSVTEQARQIRSHFWFTLTFRTVFHRKNVRNHQIPPCLSHTGLHGGSRHRSRLKISINNNKTEQNPLAFYQFCRFRLTLLDLDLAGLAGSVVTHLEAGMLATVQQGGARLLTAQQRPLAAAHGLAANKTRCVSAQA